MTPGACLNLSDEAESGLDPLDDLGHVAALLAFTDGSIGIFVFQVPEPISTQAELAVLLMLALTAARGPRSFRRTRQGANESA